MAKSVATLEKELEEAKARANQLEEELNTLKRANRGSPPGAGERLSLATPKLR